MLRLALLLLLLPLLLLLRVRFHIIRNARIENVGKNQSCMVSKLRIIWKQTVLLLDLVLRIHITYYNPRTYVSLPTDPDMLEVGVTNAQLPEPGKKCNCGPTLEEPCPPLTVTEARSHFVRSSSRQLVIRIHVYPWRHWYTSV